MKVEYVFSRNRKLGSRLIAWLAKYEGSKLNPAPSHVAVLLDETWVFESMLTSGVRVLPYENWKQLNEELYRIPCTRLQRNSREVLQKAASLWGRPYDWLGILYFAAKYLELILWGRPLPSKNKWHLPRAYFCTEFISLLKGEDCSMKSPAMLCEEMLENVDSHCDKESL